MLSRRALRWSITESVNIWMSGTRRLLPTLFPDGRVVMRGSVLVAVYLGSILSRLTVSGHTGQEGKGTRWHWGDTAFCAPWISDVEAGAIRRWTGCIGAFSYHSSILYIMSYRVKIRLTYMYMVVWNVSRLSAKDIRWDVSLRMTYGSLSCPVSLVPFIVVK